MSSPTKLSDRHLLVSYMAAAGRTRDEISEATGFSKKHLTTIMASPLFKTQLGRVRRKVGDAAVESIVEDLQVNTVVHGQSALDTLVELMDGSGNDNVRLGAATNILDRAVPKQTKHQEERTVRVSIDSEALQLMSNVCAELKEYAPETLDAEFAARDAPEPAAVQALSDRDEGTIRVTAVDDLIAQYKAQEAEEAREGSP